MAKAIDFVFDDFISVLKDVVASGESMSFSPKGKSMLPTIRENIDSVIISPAQKIKKHDIVLYRRKNGKIVLHRVVIACKDYLVLCGDNQFQLEYPITKEQVIGKVSAIKRKNRLINIENPGFLYNIYIRLWDLRLVLDKGIYYLIKFKKGLQK